MSGSLESEACGRQIQMLAESAWREVEVTSMSSITAMRQVLAALARVPGDKTVVLISGGWPLNDNEEMSIISNLATDAAAARNRHDACLRELLSEGRSGSAPECRTAD